MCSKLLGCLFWIGSKLLIIVGTLMYFFDVGSDISFSVQLFLNCHVGYGMASIIIMVVTVVFSSLFPAVSAYLIRDSTYEKPNGYLETFGYFLNYFRLNLKEFFGNEHTKAEKMYIHGIKFYLCFL